MKKNKAIVLLLSLLILLSCLLIACNTSITTLEAKSTNGYLKLGEEVDASVFFNIEGKGKIYYSVQDSDILSVSGTKVKALSIGIGYLYAMDSSGEKVARISITVTENNPNAINVVETTTIYDGNIHNIGITGSIPAGAEITYIYNGEAFAGAINAGDYVIKVSITNKDGKEVKLENNTATLHIEKATYDLTGIAFNNRTFVYDGTPKEILLTDESKLPSFVTVSYSNNRHTNAGTYICTASFTNTNPNYHDIEAMTAYLYINKKFIYLANLGFTDKEMVFDNTYHGASISNSGLEVSADFTYYKSSNGTEWEETSTPNSAFINAGVYYIGAVLTIDENINNNYAFTTNTELLTFTKNSSGQYESNRVISKITITKANLQGNLNYKITNKSGNDVTLTYGKSIAFPTYYEAQSLSTYGTDADVYVYIYGDLPIGINDEYADDIEISYDYPTSLTKNDYGYYDANQYQVKVSFTLPSDYTINYLAVTDYIYTFTIQKATFDNSYISFNYDYSEATASYSAYEYSSADFAITKNTSASSYDSTLDALLDINYFYYKVGAGNSAYELDTNKISNIGSYQIFARFSLTENAANYLSIPDMLITFKDTEHTTSTFTITKAEILVKDVSFVDFTTTYDGLEHLLVISYTDLNGISWTFKENNNPVTGYTNAGTHIVTAYFTYSDWPSNSYTIYNLNTSTEERKELTTITRTFQINKATYAGVDVSDYTVDNDYEYTYGMTLANLSINNSGSVVSWKDPESEVIMTSVSSLNEEVGLFAADALYNADPTNYLDYEFSISVQMDRLKLYIDSTTIQEQFVPSNSLVPVISYANNDYENYFNITVVHSDGENYVVTITPKYENNFLLYDNDTSLTILTEYNINAILHTYDTKLFTYVEGTCSLKTYVSTKTSADVPNYTKIIQQNAFSNSGVTFVSIPDSIVTIANSAFGTNTTINTISLPTTTYSNNITLLNMFHNSQAPESLTTVIIRNDATVKANFFKNCSVLEQVEYLNSPTEIEERAFDGCTSLRRFLTTQPDDINGDPVYTTTITTIGANAFSGCSSLEELMVKTLSHPLNYYFSGPSATYTTYALETVTFISTDSYTLPSSVFSGWSNIQQIILSSGLTTISDYSFRDVNATIDLSSIENITISAYGFANYLGTSIDLTNIQGIGNYGFKNCTKLTSISVPATLTTIGTNVFEGCTSLETITLNSNLTTLPAYMFSGCTKIATIDLSNVITISDYAFSGCTSLSSITFSNSLTTIGKNAFEGCTGLTSVTLPSSLQTLGYNSFNNACNITSVTITNEITNCDATSFANTNGAPINLYVPSSLVSYYTTIFGLKHFVIIAITN